MTKLRLIVFTAVAVAAFAVGTGEVLALVAFWRDPHQYQAFIELFRIMFSWPAVVSVLGIVAIHVFRQDLASLLGRAANLKFGKAEATFLAPPLQADIIMPARQELPVLAVAEGDAHPQSGKTGWTALLFGFVTNQRGFDTGLVVTNAAADPLGTSGRAGVCHVTYYGALFGGLSAPQCQRSHPVAPGEQLTFTLSSGGNGGMAATPAFQGYLVVVCEFPQAWGYAIISDIGMKRTAVGYAAQDISARFRTKE